MPTARARSPVTLTGFGALMDPDYLRQATSDPCAAKAVAESEREALDPLATLTRWWASCVAEIQRTREKTIRSMRF
jgi:hypothetical protein